MEKIIYTESVDGKLHEVHTLENGTYDVDYFEGELFKHNSGSGHNTLSLDNDCTGESEIWYDKEHINLTLTGKFASNECMEKKLVDNPHISEEDFYNLIEEDLSHREIEISVHKESEIVDENLLEKVLLDFEKIDTYQDITQSGEGQACILFSRDSKGYNNVFMTEEITKIEDKYKVDITITFDTDA